jgi:hypothetical protein
VGKAEEGERGAIRLRMVSLSETGRDMSSKYTPTH